MLELYDLRCEYRVNPVGVYTALPRFSWKLKSGKTDVMQTAYTLDVATDDTFTSIVWSSGRIASGESHLVPCGKELESSTAYYWRVRVWDNHGESGREYASFATSMLETSEWNAVFITMEDETAGASSAGTMMRKEFTAKGAVKRAWLYASAKGMYEAWVNGERPGDDVLAPGWTEYQHRLLFQTYDVTRLIKKGANAIGLAVGPGWYKGDLAGWLSKRNIYGKRTAVIAQLRIEYEDGGVDVIGTDESWQGAPSPVLYSEIYHGEKYDARMEQEGWNRPGFVCKTWKNAQVESRDVSMLVPADGLPVTEHERFKPVKLWTTPAGERVVDFGQNISGRVRITVRRHAGDRIKIRHAEALDAQGNFYTANLRKAKQTVEYTLKGGGVEIYQPHYTFQGFRYIAIDEWPGGVDNAAAENFEAVAIYSDMRVAGTFACSEPKLNQFISNVRWSMRDNFVDIPTDCPQRDERLGWTGDANIFSRSACFLAETAPFFRKWMRDLAVSQLPDGQVPHVVPDILQDIADHDEKISGNAAACAWADTAVGVPWNVWLYFGDKRILEDQYPSMKKWVEYVYSVAKGGVLFDSGFHFGDWVALDAKEGSYFGATPNELSATAYYAWSTEMLAKTAAILGKQEDAETYTKLRKDIGAAYVKRFFRDDGSLTAQTQTAHILSLMFDLTPEAYKKKTVDGLVRLITARNKHLDTGFLGTPYVCRVLADNGRAPLAWELLLKEDFPSWLYQVTKGATTIWEHWDGMKPDGSMWSPDMNSFNHYAYGAVADWVFSAVGGLDTDTTETGFKRFVVKPCVGRGVDWAETRYESPYGLISVRWEKKDGAVRLMLTVPPNTRARVCIGERETEFGSGSYALLRKKMLTWV